MITAEEFLADVSTAPAAKSAEDFLADRPSAEDFLTEQPGAIEGTANEFKRGLLAGQQQIVAYQRANAPKGPTIMQTRRAYVKAMSDPLYMEAVNAAGDDPRKLDRVETMLGPEARGLREYRTRVQANKDALDNQFAELEREQQAIPQSAAMSKWGNADNSNWHKVLAKNPVEITAGIMAQSLPAMAPAMAMNMVAPGGRVSKAIATGAGSFGAEAASAYLDSARATGYDFTDADKVREFFENPAAQTKAKEFALKRGVPIAVFDALTAGVAGKFINPAFKQGAKKVVMATGKEVAVQAVGGAAGEASAQLTSGQKLSAKDIVAEALGEIASGPQEVISNLREVRAARASSPPAEGPGVGAPRPLDDELPPSEPVPDNASPTVVGNNSPAAPAPTVPAGAPASVPPSTINSQPSTVPVPESVATLQAQFAATLDPNTPKAATLVTPGEESGPVPDGLLRVSSPHGVFWFNPKKTSAAAVREAAAKNAFGTLLGMSQDQKPEGGSTVVQTKDAEGTPVLDEVVTPETAAAAVEAAKAVAPEGTVEVKPAEQVIAERSADVAGQVQSQAPAGKAGKAGMTSEATAPSRRAEEALPNSFALDVSRPDLAIGLRPIKDSELYQNPDLRQLKKEEYGLTHAGTDMATGEPLYWVVRKVSALKSANRQPATQQLVTAKHLGDAREILRAQDPAPTVADELQGHGIGRVRFEPADFGDLIQNLRERLSQQMFSKPWNKLRKPQREAVDKAHVLSADAGEPADKALQILSENPKYADWSIDDLANALARATRAEAKDSTRAERALAQQIAEMEAAPPDVVDDTLTSWIEATNLKPGQLLEGVTGAPVWLTKSALNGVLRVVRATYRGTKSLAQALQAGIEWLRTQQLDGYNEAEAQDWLARNLSTHPADDDLNIREFSDQLEADQPLPPDPARMVTNLLYDRRTNETDAAFAARIIQAVGGPAAAIEVFSDGTNGLPGAVRMMLGQLIIKQLSATGQHEAAARFYDEQFAAHTTDVAQSLQSLAAFLSLTPEGKVIWAQRKLRRAAQDMLAPVTPDIEAARTEMDKVNAAGIESTTAAPDVQAAARTAVDEALQNQAGTHGTELQEAIRREALEQLRQAGLITQREMEITLLHLEAPGDTTLEQKFASAGLKDAKKRAQEILDGYKKRTNAERAKIKRIAAENRKGRKERLGNWIAKVRSIPEREREPAAKALLKAMEPSATTRPPALQEFYRRLTATLKTLLPEQATTKATPLTDVQRLREVLANPEKFAGVWEQLAVEIRAKHGLEGLAQLNTLGELSPYGLLTHAMGSRVEGAIANAMRDLQVKLANVIKLHHTKADATGQTLAQKISAAIGLDADTSTRVELAVQRKFRQMVAEKKRAALEKLLKPVARRGLAKPDLATRIIEATNLGALSAEEFWNAVRKGLKLPEWNAELAENIKRQAEAIERIPDEQTERKQKAQQEMLNTVERAKGIDGLDLGLAFYLTNILTGVTTHAKNLLSTALNTTAALGIEGARAVASGHPSDIVLAFTALGEGMKQGGRAAADVLRTGVVTGSRLQKLEPGRTLELTKFGQAGGVPIGNRFTKAMLENRIFRFLNAWKYNYRMMAAEDLLFFKPAEEAKAAILAKRIARSEGLHGAAAQDRARVILGYGRAALDAAETQAVREGLTGSTAKRRVAEILSASRPEQLREDARQFALRTTFNNTPYGFMGAVANIVNRAKASENRKLRTGANLVAPFTNIIANVVNESLNFTPIGFARSFPHSDKLLGRDLSALSLEERKDLEAELRAKALLGTAVLAGVMLKAASHLDDKDPEFAVYAGGPGTDEDRRGWQAAGGLPHSIKLGDRYYSYANTPLALPLAWMGNIHDRLRDARLYGNRSAQRTAESLPMMAVNGALGMPKVITEQSFLSGIADVAQMISEPNAERASRTGLKTIVRTASSFVVPNLVRQVDKAFDPQVYEQRNAEGVLVNAIPFVRGRQGQPMLNALGLPVTNPNAAQFSSPEGTEPIVKFLAETGNWPGTPNRNEIYPRQGRSMTDEEYYDYIRASGRAAMNKLAEFKGRGRLEFRTVNNQRVPLTREQQAEIISDIISTERGRVRHRMGF